MGDLDSKKVSVIIPTIRQFRLVEECLESLKRYTNWPRLQIIVVDDGSSRLIQERLKGVVSRYGGKLITKSRNTGFASTVNQGALEASGDYLVLANNDIRFSHSDWLIRMVQAAEEPGVGVVGARLLYPDGRIQHAGVQYVPGIQNFAHIYRHRAGDLPQAAVDRDELAVTGALMLVSKEVWLQLGGMSEEFFIAMEDVDFCLRAREKGWRVRYCGRAVAYHMEGRTRGTTPENKEPHWYMRELEGLARFRKKWFDSDRHPRFEMDHS